jgi:hypothetical protein
MWPYSPATHGSRSPLNCSRSSSSSPRRAVLTDLVQQLPPMRGLAGPPVPMRPLMGMHARERPLRDSRLRVNTEALLASGRSAEIAALDEKRCFAWKARSGERSLDLPVEEKIRGSDDRRFRFRHGHDDDAAPYVSSTAIFASRADRRFSIAHVKNPGGECQALDARDVIRM